jgi:hypothetical protein
MRAAGQASMCANVIASRFQPGLIYTRSYEVLGNVDKNNLLHIYYGKNLLTYKIKDIKI